MSGHLTTIRAALIRAHEHQTQGNRAAAAAVYRQILAQYPNDAIALNNLGLIVPEAEAVGLFRRAIAALPGYVQAMVNLALTLQNIGEPDEAVATCRQALAVVPEDPKTLFHLGEILESQGKFVEAATAYEQATALKPDYVVALLRLGLVYAAEKRHGDATDCYRRVLAIAPDSASAHLHLASALEAEGRIAEATLARANVPRPMALMIHTAPAARRTVMILAHRGTGNVPLHALLPPETNSRITWCVEFATAQQAEALPPYDVALNAVGDADIMDESVTWVSRLHARRPVLNPPNAVALTRRDRAPALLAGIDGVVVPAVLRVPRVALAHADLPALLASAGLGAPVLMRPIVAHGGEGIMRADTQDAVAALTPAAADAYYFTAYHEFRAADGYYRKYRMIFVDRQPYAYHLAISASWLVHYFSADMAAAAWKGEEERAFLADPAAVLGSRAMAAITAIARRLDLDFGGIDFSILPDGRVLVFEANATMLVHIKEKAAESPHKHAAVSTIFAAFDAMLDRHAAEQMTPT